MFYAMNSMIALHEAGAVVTLNQSTFQRISTCGAIIKNKISDLGDPLLTEYINQLYLSETQMTKISQIWTWQLEVPNAVS